MADILLIEEDEVVRPWLAWVCRGSGPHGDASGHGRAGVRAFKEFADLAITDIVMPDQEGIATIMGLHSDHPRCR